MNTGEAIQSLDNKINNAKGNLPLVQGDPTLYTNYSTYITKLEELKGFLSTDTSNPQYLEVAQTYLNLLTLDEEVQKQMESVLTSGTTQSINDLSSLLTTQITNIQKVTAASATQKNLIIDGTTLEIKDAKSQVFKKAFYDVNQNSPEINKNDVINQLDSFIKKLPKFEQGIDISANMEYQNEVAMADMIGNHLTKTAEVDLNTLEIENINQNITKILTKYANELKTFAKDDTNLTFTPAQGGDSITFISLAEKQEFLLETAELLNSLSEESGGPIAVLGNLFDAGASVLGAFGTLTYLLSYCATGLAFAGITHWGVKKVSLSGYEKIKGNQWSPDISKLNMNPKKLFGLLGTLTNFEPATGNPEKIEEYKNQIRNKMGELVAAYGANNPGVTPAQLRSSTTGFDHGVDPTLRIQLHTLEQALNRAEQSYVIKNSISQNGVDLRDFFAKIDSTTPGRMELGTRLRKIPVVSPDRFIGGNKAPLTNNPGAIQSTITVGDTQDKVASLDLERYNSIHSRYTNLMKLHTQHEALGNMRNQIAEISDISHFVNQIQAYPFDPSDNRFDDFLNRIDGTGGLYRQYVGGKMYQNFANGEQNNNNIKNKIIVGLETRYNTLRDEINAHLMTGDKINQPIGDLDQAGMTAYINAGQAGLEADFDRVALQLHAIEGSMNFDTLNIRQSKADFETHINNVANTTGLGKLKGFLKTLTR